MENGKQLAQRFREVLLDGKLVAFTNYKELLQDLTWQQATQKVSSLNTIAALTFHINYYVAGVLNVFEGGELEIRDKYSFDMPSVTNEEDWANLRSTLLANAEKFAKHMEQLTDEKLESPFVKEAYGNYRRNMEVMIEHAYYHMGQIAIIKKMILQA